MSQSPFLIEGPATISFSGGRTSGYMLRRILDEGLQPDVHVLFADTGRERDETYRFVRDVEERWAVMIHWLHRPGYFTQLITDRRCLPNPTMRFCTQELKLRPMRDFMRAHGHEHWENIVGIRHDEPGRVARMRAQNDERSERWTVAMPLHEARVTVAEVMAFWAQQPFDLQLKPYEGNCSICFLKHVNKRERIAKDRPDLLAWWVEQERRTGQFFRRDEPEYAVLPKIGNLFDADLTLPDASECYCHD